ncbi:MAG TPA: cytochrome b/b6 domain-containing protein [Thiobacillaceae bacterium]|nr:cytochrome b/b6 domain-containing protein [Thiobacillaceae bacterium]HNU64190.1 cytochrome b/b6 domain-containing protein [Thiobacillaceae bacterium]
MHKILVWDWPVRIGHWMLVGAFALAWLSSESEAWRLVHACAGGTMAGVVIFRLFWGVVGTRHARFASFVRGPGAALAYVRGLATDSPPHVVGHNPAGGWAILALLGLTLLSAASGWFVYQDAGGTWAEDLHEGLSSMLLGMVLLHVAGVLLGSLAHRENLVHAMFSGFKQGPAHAAIATARPLPVLVLLGCAVLCAWWFAQ